MLTHADHGATSPYRVLVAGGGVAGLETVLALRELAGDRVAVTLLAPQPEFVYRPLTVREPFAYGTADRHDLAEIAADLGVELVVDQLTWIDPDAHVAHSADGRELPYDALMIAVGARPVDPHPLATTIDPSRLDAQLHGLVQDVEGGYVRRLAFVIPAGMTWPLPLYELALMTAQRAYDAQAHLDITIVTPDEAPLAVFGQGAGAGLLALLDEAGIDVVRAASVDVPSAGEVVVAPGRRHLHVDRVITQPVLHGPSVRGVPGGRHNLIPIDPYCRVRGLTDVYAAGDATDYAVKQGGVSAQQAVTAARCIAAAAGAPVTPQTLRPSIHGMLLTGGRPRYLSARVGGDHGYISEISDTPSWSPPVKIVAEHLGPYLEQRALAPAPAGPASAGSTA
jgi:sulfide:quinone oxidoreductase